MDFVSLFSVKFIIRPYPPRKMSSTPSLIYMRSYHMFVVFVVAILLCSFATLETNDAADSNSKMLNPLKPTPTTFVTHSRKLKAFALLDLAASHGPLMRICIANIQIDIHMYVCKYVSVWQGVGH